MKRNILIVVVLVVALACSLFRRAPGVVTIYAQTLPVTRQVAWEQPNETAEGIERWTVTLDGVLLGTPMTKAQPITITTAGMHTVTVRAENLFLFSPVVTFTFNVVVPSAPTNVRIQ